jgi:tRNA (cytidine32/uridine32-2'-O)-methyltransferase
MTMPHTVHDNIYFILVRSVYLGNIGSVARAMKNFGFHKLRFVEPPRGYKDSEARRMSVGAFEILKNSEVFDSLTAALKDVSMSIGTTSAQQRDMNPRRLAEVAPLAAQAAGANNNVALVFGDERNGLTREDLLRCHQIMTIPTDENFPALNVGQAAAICAYEVARFAAAPSPGAAHTDTSATSAAAADYCETAADGSAGVRAAAKVPSTKAKRTAATELPSGEQNDQLFESLGMLLDTAEFSRTFNREKVLLELRAFYHRAQPTVREYELLRGALIKVNQKLSKT